MVLVVSNWVWRCVTCPSCPLCLSFLRLRDISAHVYLIALDDLEESGGETAGGQTCQKYGSQLTVLWAGFWTWRKKKGRSRLVTVLFLVTVLEVEP